MTVRPWVAQLQRLSDSRTSPTQADSEPGLLDVLSDFSAADWECLLKALAWPTPDRNILEQAFALHPDEELLPVVATALDQLGGSPLRHFGMALDALIRRHQHTPDPKTSSALLTLVKLTGMLGRGASPVLLQELVLDRTRDWVLRDEAAAALCGYDTPYDSTFWDKLDYRRDPFFIPSSLSFRAESDPRRALAFLAEYAPHYDQPGHLEIPTSTALYRMLAAEGVAATRDVLADASEAARAIVDQVLPNPEFERFGPDLAARLRAAPTSPAQSREPNQNAAVSAAESLWAALSPDQQAAWQQLFELPEFSDWRRIFPNSPVKPASAVIAEASGVSSVRSLESPPGRDAGTYAAKDFGFIHVQGTVPEHDQTGKPLR
jgi:hypothetical protein